MRIILACFNSSVIDQQMALKKTIEVPFKRAINPYIPYRFAPWNRDTSAPLTVGR